ncbi:MAG: PrsW family intramembrane metalloprotease [Treponema sp.]|jgi:hypothetical protein|nr:PrsW family intramembrane metalloprotease [Treponema sp.]
MNRALLLFFVILAASFPLVPAWLYFRKKGIDNLWFLVFAGAGFVSVFIALITQSMIPEHEHTGRSFIFHVFACISLTEESSRMITLFPLLLFVRRKFRSPISTGDFMQSDFGFAEYTGRPEFPNKPHLSGRAAGLIAGLGFAAAESVFHAVANIANPGTTLLRALLHGACGSRIGASFSFAGSRPVYAFFQFFAAVLIHGMYDLFILDTNLPYRFLSLFIALTAFWSSLLVIRQDSSA